MILRLLATTVLISFQCVGAYASEPKIKKIDPSQVESLRRALQADVSKASGRLTAWFDSVSVCAPQLWRHIGGAIDKREIELIPVHFAAADGACFKGAQGNQRLAVAVAPLLTDGIVRVPTGDEMKKYWGIFPFDEIEEPVFVIESARADILIHFQFDQEKQRYCVFFLEALRLTESKAAPNSAAP